MFPRMRFFLKIRYYHDTSLNIETQYHLYRSFAVFAADLVFYKLFLSLQQ